MEPTDTLARCRACGASAAADQRYCLSCGTRLEDVHDPVSTYLSEASAARARVAAALERQARAKSARRLPRLSPFFATVLVVVAFAVGVEVGNSSSGGPGSTARTAAAASQTKSAPKKAGGAVADNKVKSATGKDYVQQQKSLPTSVTP